MVAQLIRAREPCLCNTICLHTLCIMPRLRLGPGNESLQNGANNSVIISTDEDPSLRIESFAIINLRGVSTRLN